LHPRDIAISPGGLKLLPYLDCTLEISPINCRQYVQYYMALISPGSDDDTDDDDDDDDTDDDTDVDDDIMCLL